MNRGQIHAREPPEKDVSLHTVKEDHMSAQSNLDICSTTSSEISDSLRCQILGPNYCRRPKPSKPCRKPGYSSQFFKIVEEKSTNLKETSRIQVEAVGKSKGNFSVQESREQKYNSVGTLTQIDHHRSFEIVTHPVEEVRPQSAKTDPTIPTLQTNSPKEGRSQSVKAELASTIPQTNSRTTSKIVSTPGQETGIVKAETINIVSTTNKHNTLEVVSPLVEEIIPQFHKDNRTNNISYTNNFNKSEVVPRFLKDNSVNNIFYTNNCNNSEIVFPLIEEVGPESFESINFKSSSREQPNLTVMVNESKKSNLMSNKVDPKSKRSSVTKSQEIEKASSRNSKEPRYATVETQTIAIQTVAVGTESERDCRCYRCRNSCSCPDCVPHTYKCRHNGNDSNRSLHTSKVTNTSSCLTGNSSFENLTDYSTQTANYRDNWDNSETQSFTEEQTSEQSDDSFASDFFDLPYQNNEEYMELLQELEKKLIARNRERVRRTMQEFERRSRQNQNLDQPIFDYGRGDDSSILRKLRDRRKKREHTCCCKCRKGRFKSDILQNEKRWEEMDIDNVMESVNPCTKRGKRFTKLEGSMQRSHWQLDPRTGEWIKVSFETADYTGPFTDGDCDVKMIKPPPKCNKKECCCCMKKRI